ncbi:MAG: flagellar biosynthesis protein FlhB [Methylococcales bacterium]
MADDQDDRTEEPTGKRLADSRRKGQVARSKDLNTAVMLLVGSSTIVLLGERIAVGLWRIMEREFRIHRREIFDSNTMVIHLSNALTDAVVLIIPLLGIMVVTALVVSTSLGGWNFSWEAIQPKPSKLNPISGVKRMFSLQSLVELVKSVLKIALVFGVFWLLYVFYSKELFALGRLEIGLAILSASELLTHSFLILSASLILIAAADAPYQLWSNKQKLKMSRKDIKDENKESDGNPEVKSRIRQMQIEMVQSRMMQEVPKADVIITNPTHYAIALKYDEDSSGAPRVVAKGADLIAAQIRTLALGAGIPLVSAPPLARAIYFSTKIDKQIPAGLYLAVAQVLAYVYQLRASNETGAEPPPAPKDISVPNEFQTK